MNKIKEESTRLRGAAIARDRRDEKHESRNDRENLRV